MKARLEILQFCNRSHFSSSIGKDKYNWQSWSFFCWAVHLQCVDTMNIRTWSFTMNVFIDRQSRSLTHYRCKNFSFEHFHFVFFSLEPLFFYHSVKVFIHILNKCFISYTRVSSSYTKRFMLMMRFILFILFVFNFHQVSTIRCFSCVGVINKKQPNDPCLNPAENVGDGRVTEIDCLNTKLCWKGVTGGQLKRGCGEKRCAFLPDLNMGSFISQTCCANDLCNRTTSIEISRWLSLFTFSLYLLTLFGWIKLNFFLEFFFLESMLL